MEILNNYFLIFGNEKIRRYTYLLFSSFLNGIYIVKTSSFEKLGYINKLFQQLNQGVSFLYLLNTIINVNRVR